MEKVNASQLHEYCTKHGIKILVTDSIVKLMKSFTAGDMNQYMEAESLVSIVYAIPVIKSNSSIWGTTSDGVGGHSAVLHGNMIINVSGVKKSFIKELLTLITE